jgi:hypothetical protein
MKWLETKADLGTQFKDMSLPIAEDFAVQVSPDGRILNEISILGALVNSPHRHLLLPYTDWMTKNDPLHVNDIEELSAAMAEQFPLFEAGDIVVSMRNIDTVAVLDPNGQIKWFDALNFVRQHDPDFQSDGTISVFNNRSSLLSGSHIANLNPDTGEVTLRYPRKTGQRFFTKAGGKHQTLENGNHLITEARAGRVFEVLPDGELVWEWQQKPYNDKYVAEVLEATRYNYSEATIAGWACSD